MTRDPYRDWQEPRPIEMVGIVLLASILLPFAILASIPVLLHRVIFLRKS